MPYKLFYSVQTGEVESNQLTIDTEGVVTATICHSVPGSPVRSLGTYYLAAGASDPDLLAIGALISERQLVGGSKFSTPAQFGGRYTLFAIEMGGKETKHLADATEPLPEPLAVLADKLTALMSRVGLKAPQRAVTVQLELAPVSVAPGDQLRVTLDVRNAGRFRAQIRNFAGFREGGADGLKINFWTPAKQAGDDPDYVWSLELTGREWHVAERKALRPKEPYLDLPGPGSLRAWTDIRLPKSDPGPMVADLVYYAHEESEAEESNNELVVGFYRAEPFNLTILPRASR